ncbi:MAG TPA: hypothetical protein VH419_17420 [Nocardioidaceae bacterium]|jgi:hypothetical protein
MPRKRPLIAILNESTLITDDEIAPIVAAAQRAVDENFEPAWGATARLRQIPSGESPPAKAWWIGFFDDSDVANALGYHDVTDEDLPLGKAFVRTVQHYGASLSVDFTHELFEMLADPYVMLDVQIDNKGTRFAHEVCDAVEADELGYDVDGVLISDFVTPEWFAPHFDGPYDLKEHTSKALQLLPGGYIGVWTPEKGWSQRFGKDDGGVTDELADQPSRIWPRLGSRRQRRGRRPKRSDPQNHPTTNP